MDIDYRLDDWELDATDDNNYPIPSHNTPANCSPQEYQTVDTTNLGIDLSFLATSTPATSPSQFLNDPQQNLGTSETAYPSTSSASPVFPGAPNCSRNPESDPPSSKSSKKPQTVMGSAAKAPVNQEQKQVQDKLQEKRQREAARVKIYRDKKREEHNDYCESLKKETLARMQNCTLVLCALSERLSLLQKAKSLWTCAGELTDSEPLNLVTTESYNYPTEVENLTVEIENSKQMLKYYTEVSKKEPGSLNLKELLTENENLRKVLESLRFTNDELRRQIELLKIYISCHSPPTSPAEANGRISPRDGYEMVIECF